MQNIVYIKTSKASYQIPAEWVKFTKTDETGTHVQVCPDIESLQLEFHHPLLISDPAALALFQKSWLGDSEAAQAMLSATK